MKQENVMFLIKTFIFRAIAQKQVFWNFKVLEKLWSCLRSCLNSTKDITQRNTHGWSVTFMDILLYISHFWQLSELKDFTKHYTVYAFLNSLKGLLTYFHVTVKNISYFNIYKNIGFISFSYRNTISNISL